MPTVSAAACAFAETVAAIVAELRPFRAAVTAVKRLAIAAFAAAAASALPMRTSPAAICFARLSIGRFRAARSRPVPTIAGMAASLYAVNALAMSENAPWTSTPFPARAACTPAKAVNTPDRAPIPVESTRLTVPIARSAAPNAAIEPAVTAIEVTSPRFASIHFVKEFMTAVIRSTIGLMVEFRASPVAFIAPSTADWKRRNEPPIPASIAFAVASAWPLTSLSFARNASSSFTSFVSDIPDIIPRTSNTSFMNARRSAVGSDFVATAMSRITSAILRRLPLESVASTPTSRSTF